jgi:hypothetical protein
MQGCPLANLGELCLAGRPLSEVGGDGLGKARQPHWHNHEGHNDRSEHALSAVDCFNNSCCRKDKVFLAGCGDYLNP